MMIFLEITDSVGMNPLYEQVKARYLCNVSNADDIEFILHGQTVAHVALVLKARGCIKITFVPSTAINY